MTEKPIIFSAPRVRAIIEGRKTQFRQIVKPQPEIRNDVLGGGLVFAIRLKTTGNYQVLGLNQMAERCPFGSVGTRLWVQETWGLAGVRLAYQCLNYRADGAQIPIHKERTPISGTAFDAIHWRGPGGFTDGPHLTAIRDGWRPSIHMPRWASRITLEITGVAVERLCEISEEDAKAEGCESLEMDQDAINALANDLTEANALALALGPGTFTAKLAYMELWNDIHGKNSWSANPWVFVVKFKRVP